MAERLVMAKGQEHEKGLSGEGMRELFVVMRIVCILIVVMVP